jgi:peptidoglycan hydrolase FlgJ
MTTAAAIAASPLAATAQSPALAAKMAAARKTAEDFEGFYLSQVFDTMFSGIGSDAMFGGGNGEQMFRSLLLQEYSKAATRSGGFGIADAVQREILQAQEAK